MKGVLLLVVLVFASYILVAQAGEDSDDGSDEGSTPKPPSSSTDDDEDDDDDGKKSLVTTTTQPSKTDESQPTTTENNGVTTTEKSKEKKKKNKKDKKGKDGEGVTTPKPTNDSKSVNTSLILGVYRLHSSPRAKDFNEFLKAMEYSDRDRERVRRSYMITVSLSKRDDEEYMIKINLGFKVTTDTFKLGEEYDAKLFDGRAYRAVVGINENVLTREEKHKGFQAVHKATFSKKGFEIEMTAKNKTAKQKYSRQRNFFEALKDGFGQFFMG